MLRLKQLSLTFTALNNAMTKLKESVADNNTIKSGQNYTDATPANKQAYDNAVNAAKGVIGETNNPTMDVNTVNQKAASVKSTKDALDGQQNLQRAKTEATNAITHASDLNQAQKNALTQQVNNTQNVQAVNDIKQTTQSLNTAMTGLKRGVANHNQVVQSDNYVNADTNKKNDYNNAYNHANDIINGNAQHPVITPSDVNNALSNVTSKEHALNGEAKLNTAKQEANTALGQLNNLNNAQRQNLQSQINGAHQIETVNAIKQNATNLNSAMGNLKHAVADKDQVKRTEDYADADTAKQNAYNSAVSSAETIINQTANSTMSVDDVNRATSAVTTNKNALNGDEKLAQSKTDAARAIDALPHLNNAQKADVKSKINAASNIAGVNTVKQQGTDLNTAMGNLQGAINDEQTTLNSQNYQDATPSKKTAYTNAVQAAKDILNKSNGQNKTKDQVTEAMNQVNSAKTNLDGTRLLDQAKQTAKQQLNNMTHLTTAQKTNLTNQINSGTTVAGVHTVQSNANTLDQAMNTLRQSIANKDATKASEDYVDANNDKQTAYNNAVAAAETIINANSNPEMNPSTITQKANQVNSSKTALNGDENLAAAKQNAKTYLNTLTSITDAQMNNLISQISSATRVSGVDTVKQNAQHLDQAMANLQNGINNESQVKSFEKYRDADTNKQQEYDNAITAAKAILNKQHGPNTAQNDVEAALQRVNTAKNALNGDAKLIAAQNAAKQHLGTLTHITTAQRNDLTNQISQATNLAGVETVKQSANSLDGAMGNLQTAINDKSGTLASQNFLDADEQKRNAYNQAVSAAETILNKQTGPNTAKTAVEQALNNLNTAKHALNGTQNLNNAKQAAITAINGASDLNQKQKDALKAQANGAQRVSNAQDVQRNATELNTAMGTLKHAIADKTNMLASSKYVNADSTKQNAYTTKVTNAEHIISGTPTVVTTPSEVTAAANQVNSAKQELNGDERLRVAKQNANTAIDALTQLNTPQKAKLNEQVGQANRLEDVQTVQTNGQSLNNAMKGLRDIIANETTVKASQNYTDASPNNQSTYNNAVSNAKGIINQTNNPTMDASAITQAATQVNNAKNGLNGAENLRNAQNTAKQNLNTLSHLTNNQKSAISSQIDRAGHVSEVTAAKNAATELNTQMGNLEQAIHDQNTVKQGANFTDADKAKCDAYTNAVSRAETILNKTQGENTSKQDVEAAIQNVTSAKNALNGDQNVTNAKNTAKHALNNLTSINNAQKRDVTTKIDQATTVAGVEAVSNTGTQLNTAMANLQNGINDKANTLASENYHDADSDKKTAYTQAVTNAENILNKNSGSNLDKAAVENALSQVTNAKGALNGNHNLEQAKSNANTTINGLQHLITAQKDKLKQQVQQAQNVAGVDTVKSSANTLNGAMGTLRNSIQDNTATKNGQNYLDATESNKTNYNNAVDSANSVINATSNPNMDANAINGMANQVNTTKAALNGAQNLAQAKTTAKNNLNNLTSINNAQKDALTRSIDGATTVAGVNQETAKATELNNAMHSLQNGINDETQTKQTQKYLDAEPSKKSAYDQAVNAAKAILTKASGQNVDKAAVEQALQNVNSTKTALNGDAKLNEAKAAAKQTLGTLTHINNAQRTALDNEITQATNVEGVNTVKVKAQQLDGAMGQLETSIRDKDTTLQSQNYQDAADAKRTAYSQAVNAAATILNKTVGGNTPKADVERAMQAVTQANTALNGIQNLERAKQAANTAITNASDLNTKQKEALKAQVTSAGRVSAANGVEHTATELNTAMTALKRAIADKADTKASGNYVNADANKRQAYDEKVTAAENIVSGTPTPTLTPSDVTNAATQVTNAKTQLNGNHNLEVAKQNANTAIDGLTPLNGPQKAKLKEQVGQATTLPNVQNVRDNAQTLNTAMKGLRDSIANEATIKAGQNYTDASQNKQTDYNNAVTAAKAIIGQTTSPTMNAQEINQAKDQVTAKQQALNGQENLRTAQTNAKQHLNGLSDLTNAQKDAAKRQIEGATYVNEVTQAQNNADALNTAMTNLKNGIQDQNTIKQGVNFTDADEAKRNAYTNAVTQAEQILNKAQGPNTAKDGVETALQNVQRAKNELNGNQNVANAKTTAKNALNNLTSINNAQKEAFKTQIEGATTVAGVNQVSTTASELNTAMSNLQNGINDEAATKAAQKYTDADRDKQTAYNDAVTAAKTLLDKTAGTNDNKAAVEQALQRVNTAKTALNGDARLNEAKNTAKQQSATMSHLTDAQKENLTEQIERGTTVAGVQDIQANAGTLNQAMNQLRQSIASKDATKSSEDYQDANADLQNAYNRAVSDAEDIISATNNPEMNPDTINQKASQVNSAKSALNGDEKLAAAKQTAKSDIGRLTDLNNAQRTAANAEVDQAPNLAAVTAAKNKATSLNTVMGNLKHALAEKDNTKRSVNYTDADRPKQQAYDTAVTQAEAITNANGSNANETQVQAALNQLNQAKNDLNGDNKVAQAKESAKRALASYSNLNNAQSTAATSQIDNATTVAGVTAAQNTANELNTAMAQLQNGINDQNTVKQQVNFTDADQGKKDAYTNAVTNAQGILEKAHGQNMTKAQVEAALNQLTTAKNALNGDANARQAKSDAKANLGTLTHLNNAQKQDLTSQIEGATTVNGVNGVKTKAQDLDGAMQRLESAIANKDQTKASENYIDADPTKKTAFDNAITQAESYLNKDHGANKDKQAVEQAIQSVTTAKNALNGDANLQRAKTEATQAIDNLTHLNTAQKTALKQQVNAAQRVSGVTDLKNSATSLNNAMDQLKQAIADHDTIVAGGNYTNASPDKQGAYTDAYNAAKNIVNGSPNVITNAADVTAATQRVNNAETGLNGDTNLATAKQQAKEALRQMTHLSDAQKQSITGQIDNATLVTGVQSVKYNATNLDNAMNQLRNSIANKDAVKASQPYVDADTDKQNAYNIAVTSAENIINAQKQDLNTQVTNAPNISTVNQVKTKAEQLDKAMERLINGIQDKDQVKQSVNFTDADPEKQTAYNNAVTAAENIINQANGTNANQSQVEAALSTVTTTKQALNGDRKVTDAKNNANQTLSTLDNLNNAQKGAVTGNINQAHTVAEVTQAIQTAQELNTAMGNLKQEIADKDATKATVNFTDADQAKQQAYNTAVTNAENIISKANGSNASQTEVEQAMQRVNEAKQALNGNDNVQRAKDAANQAQQIANGTPTPVLTPDTVTQAVTTMNQAKDALNGDEKLAQAKQDALANLDTLRDLNQPQHDALRNQINQAQALATVEQTKQNAQNVNTAMGNLKQGIANKDTVKASENYHVADADKQTAYTNAVSQAEGIINQTTNPTLNPDEITRALTQVTDAKNGLNGEAKLATEKQNAKDAVNAMTHLNDAQKQALKGQIDQSPEIATVNQVKQTATSLDQAMNQLSQAINDKTQTLAEGNYLNADPDKQNAYKQAVAKAEALLNKQSGTNEVQAQVQSITNEVNTAKQALNGNDNLANAKQQAKQQLANLTHLNDAQKQSFESQITQAPLVTDVTTINQKAQALDHAMELLRNSIADNQATLASEDYHDATAQRQNDYNQAVTAAKNIINQTTSPTMNPDDINRATTQVNNTKVALDGDENLAAAKQQANNRLNQLDHLNNAQKQQLQSQITQSSDIAAVNGHKQTAESLNTAMSNLINAIADHQAVEQRGNFINADTDKQTAYTTAVNEAEAMINKQTGQNANQTEVEQAITKVQTTLQALNGDHNLQVAKTNATQAIDALTSLNDPQKTALKDQVTAATLVTAVHQIEQNANTLNQAMYGLRESIQDNAATKANSKYINEDQPEQQNYDQAVQAANSIINEQTATLDNNAIKQAATTVNTTKAALHGDVKLQNDKDHAKQTVSQLAHLNNAQKHMEDTLIDSETTRTAVKQDLTEAQALDQLMNTLQQSIADKDATRASGAYVNAEPNKKQAYDEAVQNAESIIAGLNNPTINKGNVSSATQAVTTSKNGLDGVERLAQDKQTAGNSLNHLDQLTPAQQQALENQINNATTRDKVAEIIAQAQALNEAMKALKESIKDQRQTEASSKFINEDQAQKDAYTQAVQHAKDLINKTTDPTLVKSVIDQATQAVNDAKNNLHGDQKLAQDKQRATEMLNNLNTPQRQALENQINNAGTRGEVAQKLTKAQALNQAMEALRNSIQDQQQTESGSKFINEDKPQKDGYQAAVQHAKDLINQTSNPTLDKAQVEQLTQGVNQAKDNLHGDQKLARDQQQAVTTVNALPNLNHAQQQALTDAINTAPTRTEVAQHVQTATELDHAMETLKNKVDQVNTDKAQPNYTEASTDKKEAVDQALQAAESITDPTNGSNANKDAVEQALTKIQEKVNELNGNERVAEAKAQAKQTIGQLTHLNADQIATAKQNIDQATKLQLIAELVDQATQLNQSMDQLQQAVNEHANVEQTVDYTQADSDKQNAYKQAIAAENVLKQNSNKQQVDQALQNILNAQQALNGDERVALAKTNGKHDIDQLNALNNAQQDGFKGRIDQSNDLNQIQQIVDEAKALNRAMDQLSQEITGNEGRTKGSTNYVNADTQVKQVYDETVDKAKQALDKSTGQNLTAEQVIKLNDAVTAAKKALNGEERLNNRKSEALQRLDQLTHLNNAQRQLAIQQINNAETLNKASRAINRATKLDNAMGAVQQYIDEQHLGDISSTNYINADDNLKANYDNAIANAAHELDKVQGNTIAKAEAEQLKQNIIDAQNALNGDQNLANAKDKANAFVNSLNGLNQQQQDLAHKAINNADTVSDVTDIVNNQIDLNDAMETLKHSVDNEIPKAEQTVNYQNADDNAKTNFDDAKRLANTLLNSDNTNVNDINGAIQAVNDAIQNLNGDQRLQDAKDKAIQSINQALANKLKEIEASNATEQDKLIAKNKAEELANNIIANINKATSNQAVTQIQTAGNQAIEQMHANEIPKAKIDANKDVDKRVQALIDEIDQNPNLTDKEKQALKDRINQILQQGHNDINNALTKEAIEQAKERLAQALQDIKDLVKAKEDAKNKIKALANAKRDQINSNPDLTPEQKAKALKEIDEAEKRALQNVENAQTIDQLNRGLNLGLDDIRNTHVWEVDDQPAVNEISEATPEQLLVNGELIVHRDDIITEQDVLAHINLIDQLTAEVIDTPSTATISDSLIAKVEVTLLDGSKVIVNVPVKVVEKELSVVKQQAIESIENAAQQKINEINNSVTLTLEQKEAAIAEVNKLKQQAIDHINNAPDVHSVEEIQQQEQAHIEQFNPEQFTIEQAKSNAIKSIEDAIQHMIDEIKARTDLTDKEKQEAIAKLNQLKEQAIQAIQRAQSIDEITEQLEQFKAQMKAANPIAKELAKRKQEAISRIKDFSNEKMNSIRNSEIGSADEKQAAMNRINEIVLETIRDINNAHTLQQVEAALNNGIARISAVQIVTSDRAKQSSSTGNESNSHLTIGYGTANHPFNSSTIGHKQKLDEDDDIDPLHMRHFSNNFGNVIKNAIGVVGISGLLASFWFFIAKRRRKEDEEEELEIRDNNKDSIKETLDDTKHLPLLFAKRRRKEDEEDVTVAEKDSLNNGESLDKVKHTPFFLPKRRRKEDEEDVEVTNENTDEEVLKDNEHSPLLIAKRRKDKEEDVETTTSIESKDEDVPLLLAKKKNQKDNQSEDKKSASKNTSKKVAAKKKKKKSKKNKK